MIIYIDIIIILNSLLNFIFLYVIEKIFADKINGIRLVISSLVGSLFIFGYLFNYYLYLLLKLFGGVVIVLIGLKLITLPKQIIKISLFYTINFAFVGFLSSFNITKPLLLFLGLTVILGLVIIESNRKYFQYINSNKYKVCIELNGKKIFMSGYVDSGNLCHYNEVPVIFINKKYYEYFNISEHNIKNSIVVETVNCYEIVDIYCPEKACIKIKRRMCEKEVYIAFSKINNDCLLNPGVLI